MEYHEPVMLAEAVDGLAIFNDGVYVDVTFGGGGHSREILKRLETGKLIAFDKDTDAIKNKIKNEKFQLVGMDFRNIENWFLDQGIAGCNGLLADLGVSSHQFDVPERGFSIRFDGDLDMRMDKSSGLTACDVLNTYSEKELSRVLYEYGELRNANGIAKLIVSKCEQGAIKTTGQLKAIVRHCSPRNKENKFFARVFQALRIEVNSEMDALKELLTQSANLLEKGGRLVVISYHSLEDRLVKNFIEKGNFQGIVETDLYGNPQLLFRSLHRKPILPTDIEIEKNNRARSAKLRIAEKI
jgi:16S rRNA (cytosine1402-N4)-methyltransferase